MKLHIEGMSDPVTTLAEAVEDLELSLGNSNQASEDWSLPPRVVSDKSDQPIEGAL